MTGVLRFLRRTSLDELQQPSAMVEGEISLVRPAPVIRHGFSGSPPWQRRRLAVLPKITGS
ncbi:MAG: sugar transferase [Gemmatimonadaceae bacterium]